MLHGLATVLLVVAGLPSAYVPLKPAAAAPAVPFFVPKATWQETVLASREELLRREADAEEQQAQVKAADPLLKEFQPLRLEFGGKEPPRKVRIRVAGLKSLAIGASGPLECCFGDPQWIDAKGRPEPMALDRVRLNGRSFQHDGNDRWEPMKLHGQTFPRGFRLHDGEITVELEGNAQWLELWVGTHARGEGQVGQFWVDYRSVRRQEEKATADRETIWRLTSEKFPDRQAIAQRRLEESDRIWEKDWRSGDLSELSQRYAAACRKSREKAVKLAGSVKTSAELEAVRNLYYFDRVAPYLELAKKTLAMVEQAAPRPALAAELTTLERQVSRAEQEAAPDGRSLYFKVADLRRRIILSHPLLAFDRLLINKRSGQLPEHMCDQYLGRHSRPGPGLVVLDSWKDHPRETVLLDGKLPAGGLIHPDLSFDGKRVLFAFADHTSPRAGRLRGYSIYELSLERGEVRQITGTDQDPLTGLYGRQTVLIEDMDPCYLPDGGFAFISTRSQQFGRCHGGRYVPAYTLFRGELDGSRLRPLSFNESNEWGPSVLPDGLLVYTRWDYVNRHDTRFQSLWVMQPDGTGTAHYYGNNSPSPCLIGEARAIPGTHRVVATAAAHHGQTMGTLIVVDPYKGQDHGAPLHWITPELPFPEAAVPPGITSAEKPLPELAALPGRTRGARAATPYALSEDLFLAAYQNGPEMAIYLIDTLGGRELIYADAAISCFDPIPLRPTPRPPAMPSSIAGHEDEETGRLFVQDVYQSSDPIERGTIKSLRINEIISQPTSSAPVRSMVSNELVKRVLGTVPVADDGSVAFQAPARKLLQLQLLDAHGMAVMTMRSSIYLQPGEQASCAGCHESRRAAPVETARLAPRTVHSIRPPAGPRYDGGLSFVRTVQPVLDRYCIQCHGLEKTEKDVDLLGCMEEFAGQGKQRRQRGPREFSRSYLSLVSGGLVKLAPRNGETFPSHPDDYFARASRLAPLLLEGHPDPQGHQRVQLDSQSLQRIVDWLDLNGQFYGDYSFNRSENQPPSPEGEKALREAVAGRFGRALAEQPYAALVNVAQPDESRILKAPLAEKAGGWGQIARNGWPSTADPAYREMRRLVESLITPLPYHDAAGTCGRDAGCRCGVCWVRQDRESRLKERTATVAATGPASRRMP